MRIYLTDLFTNHASKKEWSGMFNVLKEKKKKTSSLETVSSEVILKKVRRNTFSNKPKNEEFIASKPTLLRNAKKKSFREK